MKAYRLRRCDGNPKYWLLARIINGAESDCCACYWTGNLDMLVGKIETGSHVELIP